MEKNAWMIGFILIIVLLILILKWNAKIVGNFFLRGILGTICIYGINQLLSMNQLFSIIQCNARTFLTTGILGFPGVFLLYVIEILYFI